MFIDTHAHITSETFSDQEIEEMLQRACEAEVSHILNICTDLITLQRGIALSEQHP